MNFAPTQQWEKIPIYNDSGEDIPPFACMGVKGGRVVDGVTYLDVEKPGTTLRNQYLFNGPGVLYTAENRRRGIGYRGPLFLCKTSPTFGQAFGPKPGQWELELGFPTLAIIDCVHISSGSVYIGYGEYRPFANLYCKANASIGANAMATGNKYVIMGGTHGSEADCGFTTVPDSFNRGVAIVNNDPLWLTFANNGWYMGKIC